VKINSSYPIRVIVVLCALFIMVGVIMGRIFDLHVLRKDELQKSGNARSVRHLPMPAHRGVIYDRNGEPLAISTKVYNLWFNSALIDIQDDRWYQVAQLLNINAEQLFDKLKKAQNQNKEFTYLVRALTPNVSAEVSELKIKGLYKEDSYKRFYPAANVAAHVVGLTDIDDIGSEGLEFAYNNVLTGKVGLKRFEKDLRGKLLDVEQVIIPPEQGKDLSLSIDLRLQYIAMRELEKTVVKHNAQAGIVMVADVKTGEILSLVNYPSYNPNNRDEVVPQNMRNIALVDVFEIGSTAKPFSMLAALASGKWRETDIVDVWPFKIELDGYPIEDVTRNNGSKLDLTKILINSSNVGMSKIALNVGAVPIYQVMYDFGLGKGTTLGFPGERIGDIPSHRVWSASATATLSFGYGVSVNAAQLLQAYSVIANEGTFIPLTIFRQDDKSKIQAISVFDANIVRRLKGMLRKVVEDQRGTILARVPNYAVAGKSGTSRKYINGKHSNKEHNALFVGFAPVNNSRYAVLVFIDNPRGGEYFGGKVAAPLFSKVMEETLRLMNVPEGDK